MESQQLQQQQQQQQQYQPTRQVGFGVELGSQPLQVTNTGEGSHLLNQQPVSIGPVLLGSDAPLNVNMSCVGGSLTLPATPLRVLESRARPLVSENQCLVLKSNSGYVEQGLACVQKPALCVGDTVSHMYVNQERVLSASGEVQQPYGGLCTVHPHGFQPIYKKSQTSVSRCDSVSTQVQSGPGPVQLNPRFDTVSPAVVSGSCESQQRVGGLAVAVAPENVSDALLHVLSGARCAQNVAEAVSSDEAASQQLNEQMSRLQLGQPDQQQPFVLPPIDLRAQEIEMLRRRLAVLEAEQNVQPLQQQPEQVQFSTPQPVQQLPRVLHGYTDEQQPVPGERKWLGDALMEFMPSGIWMQVGHASMYAAESQVSGISPERFESPELQRGIPAFADDNIVNVGQNVGVGGVQSGDLLGSFAAESEQPQRQLFQHAVVESSAVPRLVPKEIKLEKPLVFDGAHKDFQNWKFVMLQFLDSSGLGDGGTACRYAVSFLRGDALTWWRAFARDGQSVFQHLTLDVLMSEMTRQFTDLDRELKVRDRLLSLKQTHNVQSYVTQFQKLQLELGDNRLDDAVSLHIFVQGLKPFTRQQVHLQRPASLQDAICLAERCDQSLSWLKGGQRQQNFVSHRNASQYSGVKTQGPAPMVLGSMSRNGVRQAGGSRPVYPSRPGGAGTAPGTSSVSVKCHHCGKVGHLKRNCFKLQNELKRTAGGKPASKN